MLPCDTTLLIVTAPLTVAAPTTLRVVLTFADPVTVVLPRAAVLVTLNAPVTFATPATVKYELILAKPVTVVFPVPVTPDILSAVAFTVPPKVP